MLSGKLKQTTFLHGLTTEVQILIQFTITKLLLLMNTESTTMNRSNFIVGVSSMR